MKSQEPEEKLMPNIVRRKLGFGILGAVLAVFSAAEVILGKNAGRSQIYPFQDMFRSKQAKPTRGVAHHFLIA